MPQVTSGYLIRRNNMTANSLTADIAGLSLEAVVRAVYMVEQLIVTWQTKQANEQDAAQDSAEETE